MKYELGLLALASLAVSTPFQKIDAAAPTDIGIHKRDTPPGNATGCTTLATAGNAPGTNPDTPQDFLANPVYANAALNAVTPTGYSAVFVNKQASAQDPSYITYTTKGMTSYDPSICASYCTAHAGCLSFNMYYERDPAYTTSSTCQNPPSTVFLKCDIYGAPLTEASATNIGQWRSKFHTAHAGSNAYTLNPVYGTPGTGLTYYAYNNPYPPPASGIFPSLDAFQSDNYFATGIIQDIPGSINFGDYGVCSIEGQSLNGCPDTFGLAMKGFFIAPQTGTYTFSAPNVDDYWYIWHGDEALSGWNANNFDAQAHWLSGGYSYSINLAKGYVLPILFLYVNQGGPGRALLNTQFPDGTTTGSTTGLFTPVNPNNNPFLFSETP